MRVDVHQHIWPEELIEALRRRRRAPRLDGWTLHLDDEPEFTVDPSTHGPALRADQAARDGVDVAGLLHLAEPAFTADAGADLGRVVGADELPAIGQEDQRVLLRLGVQMRVPMGQATSSASSAPGAANSWAQT